ncbi:MAG: double-strand break repair helicase AddA, partial [Pikeienuella sp.]
MSGPENPAVAAQRGASDPARSVWVAANAGAGKTRVLTERVARLLLAGARPEKILCLTYTRAAAAEMRNRLFAMLGGWSMDGDAALAKALRDLTGGAAPDDLDRARRLFAEALETPGGLKIQTIHAFCEGILRRFPLEAGAPPGFSVMDERERDALIAEVLEDLATGPARPALTAIAADLNEDGIDALARTIAAKPELFPDPADEAGLAARFGVPNPPEEEAAVAGALDGLDPSALKRMIAAWARGAAGDQKKAAELAAASGPALAPALEAALLTKEGAPRARLATKGAQAAEPDWEALCAHLADIALAAREARLAAAAAARAIRLARFGAAFSGAYQGAKRARSRLDFNDLVGCARALFTEAEMAAWALYRLDGGVEHILVDEAQDTSPEQWQVIDAIAAEFRAGEGARGEGRTSFVVGDEKQSIYSFQGAAPGMFEEMRQRFETGLAPLGGLRQVALEASFRSAPAVLRAVDAVFSGERAAGLTASGAPTRHSAFFDRRAGRVELWPLVPPDDAGEAPEPWSPVDMPGPREARLKLAGITARRVRALCEGARLPGGGRRVRPGDILILLRSRAPIMAPLIRALKREGVPVAGADRLAMGDSLAVKDLLALARFAVTPDDDLTLAALLRSPLFDVDEDGLFDLAHGREGTLWRSLRAAAGRWPREAAVLALATRDADFLRPYEFFEKALTTPEAPGRDGRRRLIARLGRDAEDPIDELLTQALAYEAEESPSLEGFLGWFAAGDQEIKREQEGGRGEVRVMTAHGAKGLQAPVVILPDTMGRPGAHRPDPVAEIDGRGVWRGVKDEEPEPLAATREKEAELAAAEHRRLLYVAMTRAEDWLIIAGAGEDDPKKLEGVWYGLAREGFSGLETREEEAPEGLGAMLVFETPGEGRGEERAADAPPLPAVEAWMETPPPVAPRAPRRVAASALAPAIAAGGV